MVALGSAFAALAAGSTPHEEDRGRVRTPVESRDRVGPHPGPAAAARRRRRARRRPSAPHPPRSGAAGCRSHPVLLAAGGRLGRIVSAAPVVGVVPGARHDRGRRGHAARPRSSGSEAILAAELAALDLACSRFRPDSELASGERPRPARSSRSARCSPRPCASRSTRRACSDGLVDPTLGAQLRAAGYDRTFALVRERDTWRVCANAPHAAASWQDVELDDERAHAARPGGVELDLGATAKALGGRPRGAAHRRDDRRRRARLRSAATSRSPGRRRTAAGRCASPTITPRRSPSPGPAVAITAGGLATSGTAVRRWRTDRGRGPSHPRPAHRPAGAHAVAHRHRRRRVLRRREHRSDRGGRPRRARHSTGSPHARLPARARPPRRLGRPRRRLAARRPRRHDPRGRARNGKTLWYLTRGARRRRARCS